MYVCTVYMYIYIYMFINVCECIRCFFEGQNSSFEGQYMFKNVLEMLRPVVVNQLLFVILQIQLCDA